MMDHQPATDRQRGEALGEDFEHHQMAVHRQEQQGHQHGEKNCPITATDTPFVGSIIEAKPMPIWIATICPATTKAWKNSCKEKAQYRANDDLLGNQQQCAQVQRVDRRHRRQAGSDHEGDRQGESTGVRAGAPGSYRKSA